jgi:hypothetical protein
MEEQIWPISVHYSTNSGKEGSFMFDKKSLDVEIVEGDLVFFNHKMIGFYTLFYPDYNYVYELT